MIEAFVTATVGGMIFLYWLEKKKIDAFPEEFNLIRFLKGGTPIGPDPTLDQVQSKLNPQDNPQPQNKSKTPKTCVEIIAKSKGEIHFNVKK